MAAASEPSSEGETSDDRKSDNGWISVVRRNKNCGGRTASPRSSRPPVAIVLRPERVKTISEAEKLLTTPQAETIKRRHRTMNNVSPPLVIRRRPSNSWWGAPSVRRSSPRTAKRPRTGPDRTDLGPDRSPGPASVLNGPVLVLNFSGKLRTSPGPVQTGLLPLFNRGSN